MKPSYLLALLLPLFSCNTDDTLSEAQRLYDQAHQKIAPVAGGVTNKTNEEIEKLTKIEYQILTVERDSNGTSIETMLQKAGQERWDCFEVIPQDTRLMFVCKRLPISYLKLLSGFVF